MCRVHISTSNPLHGELITVDDVDEIVAMYVLAPLPNPQCAGY